MFVLGIQLALILLLTFLSLLFYHERRISKPTEELPLPKQKSILWFPHNKLYHEWLLDQFRQLGRTWITSHGRKSVICTYDPDWVREITTKQFDCFRNILSDKLNPEDTTLDLSGDETWKTLKKYLTPTFTPKRVKLMVEPIENIAKNFTEFLLRQDTKELDLKPKLFHFAIDVICKVVFGILTKCHRNENQEIIDLAHKVLENYRLKTYFDDFKYHFPSLFPTQYWNQSAKIFSQMTKEIIDQRENVKNVGDFIDRLKMMKMEGLDEKLVNAQGMMFITSGYEISNVLGSLIFHVSANPDVQELIIQEICMYEENYNLKKLKYLEACIYETLRICPPVLCQYRHCVQDCIINGIQVKKGTNIQLAIHASHMDPEYFCQPSKFKPERFLRLKPLIKPFTYRPFGCGYRCSIGQQLSITIIKVFMVQFMKSFKIKNLDGKLKFNKGYLNFHNHQTIMVGLEPRTDYDLQRKYSHCLIAENIKKSRKLSILGKKSSLRKMSKMSICNGQLRKKSSKRRISFANCLQRSRKVALVPELNVQHIQL